MASEYVTDPWALTPIQEAEGGVLLKRDDLFQCEANGLSVRGGKARACMLMSQGAKGLTCGSHRDSLQQAIVAVVARRLGIPCVVHTAEGKETDQQAYAIEAGAEIQRHSPGYNTLVTARARKFGEESGFTVVPFGMESEWQIRGTAAQAENLPAGGFKRLVISMGIGMSLSGVLQGLERRGIFVPVLGIAVGADPSRWTSKYTSRKWDGLLEIRKSEHAYSKKIEGSIGGAAMDRVYEAKALEFLKPGDLFWVVGIRPTRGSGESEN